MTARPPRAHRRTLRGLEGGFTLIELLVALTLFGLISIVVMGGLRFGTRVWETGETRAQAVAEVEAVQGILRRYLAQATVPQLFGSNTQDVPLFVGEVESLLFVTITPAHVGVGGLYQVRIAKVDGNGEGEGSLELTWRIFRPDDPRAIEEDPGEDDTLAAGRRTLLTGVKSVTFAYLKSDGPGFGEPEWEETWEEDIPGLIAMNVEFSPGSGRVWPVLVVQTRLAGGN
jgi:general secretion pathway protein J